MTRMSGVATAKLFLIGALIAFVSSIALAQSGQGADQDKQDKDDRGGGADKVLYIWAQDQAQVAPDFLAVIDFDERSPKYGQLIQVVPVPPPGPLQGRMSLSACP